MNSRLLFRIVGLCGQECTELIAHCLDRELFLKYITRTFLESPSFEECRQLVLELGVRFTRISLAARDCIAGVGMDFCKMATRCCCTVEFLCHGVSLDSSVRSQILEHKLFGRMTRCSGNQGGAVLCAGGYSQHHVAVYRIGSLDSEFRVVV